MAELTRPTDEEALQKREAIGVIRASRFVRRHAQSTKPITVATICLIHTEIFQEAWPEIAGKFRTENLEITDSHHRPPHHTEVPGLMLGMDKELTERLVKLQPVQGMFFDRTKEPNEKELQMVQEIIESAAWAHHRITYIHPFRDGNGRTARLLANLLLERYGLVGISIKIERENKNKYRQALNQIDQMGDYEPLVGIIIEGLIDRYGGVKMKMI